MPQLELYENKILNDEELPIQLSVDRRDREVEVFSSHWHEHVEMHYIVQGAADMKLGQTVYQARQGDLLISNSNVLHTACCTQVPYEAYVIIFDMADLSRELAGKNYIFTPLIRDDPVIREIVLRIFVELQEGKLGYKQLCRALVSQLVVCLCREYVELTLPEKDSIKRK